MVCSFDITEAVKTELTWLYLMLTAVGQMQIQGQGHIQGQGQIV